MLLLILIGCPSPYPLRDYGCPGHEAMVAISAGALDVRLVEGQRACVRAPPSSLVTFEQPSQDLSIEVLRTDTDGDVEPGITRPGVVVEPLVRKQGRPQSGGALTHWQDFGSAQYQWSAARDEVSSITSFRGLQVVSEGSGYVGVSNTLDEIHIRCEGCEVWIPVAPGTVHLDVVDATVHLCVTDATVLDDILAVQSTLHVIATERPARNTIVLQDTQVIVQSPGQLDWVPALFGEFTFVEGETEFCL